TGQMMQDTAPIPFLWILPLALYLLSFIICFDSERWYRRGIFHSLLGVAIFTSFLFVIYIDRISATVGRVVLSSTTVTLLLEIGNSSLLMFAGSMVCHGELVRLKPHRRDLTVFYLMVSAGGAVGGIFSVVVAPLLFSGFWDFRFAVWTCVVLMTIALMRDRASWIYRRTAAAGIAILAAALAFPLLIGLVVHAWTYAAVAFAMVAAVALMVRRKNPPWRLGRSGIVTLLSMAAAIAVLAAVYIDTIAIGMHDTLWITRNFYGVFRVVGAEAPDHRWHSYQLMNGRVTHGKQFFSSAYPRMRYYPTTYYCLNSGIGLVLMNYPRGPENSSLRVGVVGLGVGTIAAWGRPGDDFRFYEINPAVVDAATDPNGYFSFIRDSSAHMAIVPGDARLSMEREVAEGHSQQFDVLAIDAFNGDAVPTHLLTREAMLIYLSELKPDGVLAVHVSNLYLDLRPVLAEHSRDLNLRYGFVHVDEKDMVDWASDWVLLSRNDKVLGQPKISARLEPRDQVRRVRPWTDDYSNLFQLLK
ncbi:MAG TPA: fused MFS/spermidine synthase, partial [Candidatus Binataceae bacterium]|nr:fused MFS/spermidine synthase [Candidatus Binataceae bacterium]